MADLQIYLSALALSVLVFAALWPASVWMRDVSIVDAWWGPGFFGAAVLVYCLSEAEGVRAIALLAVVGVWALRLGFVLIRRRIRHGSEDGRYVVVRKGWGASFWWKSFFIVFLLQGALQWVISFPALAGITADPSPLGVLGVIGLGLALTGFAIECKADAELDAFKKTARHSDLLTSGLRSHVQHPNYSGEMIFWWGIWLTAAEAGAWWTVFAPITLTFLLTKVSGAGLTAEYLQKTKPEFEAYRRRTPAFVPRLSK